MVARKKSCIYQIKIRFISNVSQTKIFRPHLLSCNVPMIDARNNTTNNALMKMNGFQKNACAGMINIMKRIIPEIISVIMPKMTNIHKLIGLFINILPNNPYYNHKTGLYLSVDNHYRSYDVYYNYSKALDNCWYWVNNHANLGMLAYRK